MSDLSKPDQPLTISLKSCLVDNTDAEFRQLIHAMVAFSARLLTIRDGFGTLISVSGIQYSILSSIAHHPPHTKLTVNKIASHLHLSAAFLTIETGKLKKQGLINKTPNPEDKRETLLSITPKGNALLSQLAPDQQMTNDVLFESLSRKEFQVLHAVFERLVHNADKAHLDLTHLIKRQTKA